MTFCTKKIFNKFQNKTLFTVLYSCKFPSQHLIENFFKINLESFTDVDCESQFRGSSRQITFQEVEQTSLIMLYNMLSFYRRYKLPLPFIGDFICVGICV